MGEAIVLIGPMGVGKTTVGKKLAKALRIDFIDTDRQIVSDYGPISKIFEERGEIAFRQLESEALSVALSKGGVVATGGGIVTVASNRELLANHTVFYLSTDGKHIAARLLAGKRPLLKKGVEDWKRIYEERKPWYKQCATFEISTSGKPLSAVVKEIVELVEQK
jgi:shikimate kinase